MMAILIILPACTTAPPPRQIDVSAAATAAAELAVAEAAPVIPPLPAECYVDTPHAPLIDGKEKTVILREERDQLKAANHKRFVCASFHNVLREARASGPQ